MDRPRRVQFLAMLLLLAAGPFARCGEPSPPVVVREDGAKTQVRRERTGTLLILSVPPEITIECEALGLKAAGKSDDVWIAENIPPGDYALAFVDPATKRKLTFQAKLDAGKPLSLKVDFEYNKIDNLSEAFWEFMAKMEKMEKMEKERWKTPADPSIVVPPVIREKALLGDHWETIPGTGGGWGGGHGTGTGVDPALTGGSFGKRNGGGRKLMVKRHGGSKQTETAVDSALLWLANHQEPDGHWDAKKYGAGEKTDTAVTGFALLAFLGAGHTENVGEYKDNVKRAVAWLMSKQAASGLIYDTTDAGGHRGEGYPGAIATLALVEAAGMANVPATRAAAQKAIEYCTEVHQCGEGADKGGWRYRPKQGADTSVTGWFIMALKSAKVAGLHVNPAAFNGAIKYLDTVEHTEGAPGEYGQPSSYWYTLKDAHYGTAYRLTAIGNHCRQVLGWKKEDLQPSVAGFVKLGGLPEWGGNFDKVDLYYWYFGTLCVFQQGGELWDTWNSSMKTALTASQCKAGDDQGSWDPVGAYSTEWGRVGQTALSALCLEVYYRYRAQP